MFSPVLAFAQALGNIDALVVAFGSIIKKVIPIVFALAIIYFFFGLIKFIRSAGDPKAASEGKSIMIYGIIAIAVMISVYGLIVWLQTTFGVGTQTSLPIPTVLGI